MVQAGDDSLMVWIRVLSLNYYNLPTPTVVAEYGLHRRLFVCLSVCLSARYLNNRCSYDHHRKCSTTM